MEPVLQPSPIQIPMTARVTYDFTIGNGRTFVRRLLRELRTTHNDLYTLVARGHLVSPSTGHTIIADIADLPLIAGSRATAVDEQALPTMTPTKDRKDQTLDAALKDTHKVLPAIIDQADDRLAGIILSRITSEAGVASLE